ncbi:N-acetylgalactosamine kinase [Chionoecetes opilio]|uniref:N-acetylgalactosamine kinase n=1 Tax=Chionoecetes opilio TaxID=41210 RepID=A0A8J4Y7N6_CHIOP|nr:N-acetylgalactosamine kinase [Chionoecetes opilio]
MMPETFLSWWQFNNARGKQPDMSNKCPPVLHVPAAGEQAQRLAALSQTFISAFTQQPQFFTRAPGRVNLIGEHVDYCGYAVFPMAVEQDILVAVAINTSGRLNICNVDANFPPYSCDINNYEINKERPVWHNYILSGVRGIQDEGGMQQPFIGINMAVTGNVPPSSGLSSSSALVCASALGMAHSHGLSLSQETLAEICARCERHVGTQGGGMDQAIAFLATKDTAKLIEFNPLQATSVTLPPGATFVVANCLAPMNKAANSYFNCRVMECRLATQVMAKKAGLPWRTFQKLGDLQRALDKTLLQMITLVEDSFEVRPYSKRQVCELLNTTPDELNQVSLSENTRHIQEFKLHDRALHVFSEAHRVWEFKKVCVEGGAYALHTLGRLMQESHKSTQLLYECSHPKLDTLVELSKGLALGARLTGAGWGGCMVALVEEDKVEQYKEHLWKSYYSKEAAAEGRPRNTLLFSSPPGPGACVFVK